MIVSFTPSVGRSLFNPAKRVGILADDGCRLSLPGKFSTVVE
jgi:hypothetical protein